MRINIYNIRWVNIQYQHHASTSHADWLVSGLLLLMTNQKLSLGSCHSCWLISNILSRSAVVFILFLSLDTISAPEGVMYFQNTKFQDLHIKSYVAGNQFNSLVKMVLNCTYNIGFGREFVDLDCHLLSCLELCCDYFSNLMWLHIWVSQTCKHLPEFMLFIYCKYMKYSI